MKKSSTFGFTLAEVLITLGIIGVVAALTIPNMIQNSRNKEFQVQLKKVYSEWNQISMQYMNDHEESIPEAVAEEYAKNHNAKIFSQELLKYIKGVNKYSEWNWTTKDEDGNTVSVNSQPYKTYNLKAGATVMPCDASVYGGMSMDIGGKIFTFDDPPSQGKNGPRLCVDLNGSRKPNTFGIDIFSFLFTTDGHIIPEGQPHKDSSYKGIGAISDSGNTVSVLDGTDYCTGYRITCGYYALNDKNPLGAGTYWKDYIGKKLYKK